MSPKAASGGSNIYIAGLMAAWFVGNFFYSVWNKDAASTMPDTKEWAMAISTVQLAVGAGYAIIMWLSTIRKLPSCTVSDYIQLVPVAVCNAGAHAASVFSLAAGGVTFGQIIKASEPAFAAVVNVIFYNKKVSAAQWLTLIPIIGGIAICCVKIDFTTYTVIAEKNFFSMGGFIGAVVANAFAAFKGSEQKRVMDTPGLKERIGGANNQFAIVNLLSLLVSIPLMFIFPIVNGKDMNQNLTVFVEKMSDFSGPTFKYVMLSGAVFYFYNEVVLLCTAAGLSPTSSSVANTAKRAVVIFGDAAWYNKIISTEQYLGSAICIFGVGLYATIDEILSGKPKQH